MSVAAACLRRWYVSAPLVGLTILLALLQASGAAAQHARSASYLVVSPGGSPGAGASSNPLSTASNALEALVERLNSPDVGSRVSDLHADTEVSAASASRGTILTLEAVGSSQQSTENALTQFSGLAEEAFVDLQERIGAPTVNHYELVPLSVSGTTSTYPDRNRNVGLVLLGGLLISALLAQLVDTLMLRRRLPAEPRNPLSHAHPDASGMDGVGARHAATSRAERPRSGVPSTSDTAGPDAS